MFCQMVSLSFNEVKQKLKFHPEEERRNNDGQIKSLCARAQPGNVSLCAAAWRTDLFFPYLCTGD